MPDPLPFYVSPEAERRLIQVGDVPGMQPGIVRTLRYDVHNKDGELTEEYVGEHFSVGFDSPQTWASAHSAISVILVQREFWLRPDTVATLRGKTLTVIHRDVGRGKHAGTFRDILVAV